MMTGGFIPVDSNLLQHFLGDSVASGGLKQKKMMREK